MMTLESNILNDLLRHCAIVKFGSFYTRRSDKRPYFIVDNSGLSDRRD
jgi:hypothetical protein